VSDEISPTPADEEPKQTPGELAQDSEELAMTSDGADASAGDAASGRTGPTGPPNLADHATIEEVLASMAPIDEDDDRADDGDGDDLADELGALLRERMIQAVSAIEPKSGTLEYLYRAVPARRKRRQTALATTAVTVFAVSSAVTLASRGTLSGGHSQASDGANVSSRFPSSQNAVSGGSGARGTGNASDSHTPVLAYPSTTTPPGVSQMSKPAPFATPPTMSFTGAQPLPNCQNSSMASVVPTSGPIAIGVSYETMTATVQTACTLAGPPQLYVYDAAGAVSTKVPVYKEDLTVVPGLAKVDTWGRQLILKPGDKFQFQFAWVQTACPPPPSTSPPTSAPSSPPPSTSVVPTSLAASVPLATIPLPSLPTTPTAAQSDSPSPSIAPPSAVSYLVAYSVYGAQPIANATFSTTCGAAVYVTDIFQNGEYPAPHILVVPQNLSPSS